MVAILVSFDDRNDKHQISSAKSKSLLICISQMAAENCQLHVLAGVLSLNLRFLWESETTSITMRHCLTSVSAKW